MLDVAAVAAVSEDRIGPTWPYPLLVAGHHPLLIAGRPTPEAETGYEDHQDEAGAEQHIASWLRDQDRLIWRRLAKRETACHGDHRADADSRARLNASGESFHSPYPGSWPYKRIAWLRPLIFALLSTDPGGSVCAGEPDTQQRHRCRLRYPYYLGEGRSDSEDEACRQRE